jgi:DNA-binding transcriptional LysR family regulator
MDLYQLRYFLEVAREKNFTRAAGNLGISAPAVSKSVSLLEKSIRRRLFTRSRRHVELTVDGEYLKEQAQRIFDIIERSRLDLSGGGDHGPAMLKIGSREMITNYLLAPGLKAFRDKHPGTRFGLYELGPRDMVDALKKDLIDFAFDYHAEVPDPALEVRRLGAVNSHIYAALALFPKRRIPRSFEEVLFLPFIAPRYFRGDPAEPSADGFPDQKHPRRIQYEGEFLETHRRYVLDGIAAAVLPDFVVRREWRAGVVSRLPGPPLGREIYFFKRRDRPLPQSVAIFVAALERTIKRLA